MLSFVFHFTFITMLKIFSSIFFLMSMASSYGEGDWFSNKKAPRKYFTLLNYGSNQNQELMLTELKTKHSVIILRHYVIQFFTSQYWRCNIPFNFANKEVIFICYVLVIGWQDLLVVIKKKKMFYHLLLT